MSGVFKLRGVDVFEVLDCRSVSSEFRAGAARKDYLPELDSFTERLSACGVLILCLARHWKGCLRFRDALTRL
jgi:hypothetical protein